MTTFNETEIQSKTIDWLRFPLAILVIFIHMDPVVNMQSVDFLNLNLHSWYDITGTLVSKTIAEIAVPCFYMFSGFLFFNKIKEWNKTLYITKVKTRLRTLVVPYILFNVCALVLFAIPKILQADGSIDVYLHKLLDNWVGVFWNYTSWTADYQNIFGQPLINYGPCALPLWFLRDLIVMAFISPIVYYLVKYTGIWGLVVLFCFYYTKIWVEIPGYSANLFLTAFFYFSLGAFFSVNKKNIVISLRKYRFVWFIVAAVAMLLSVYFSKTPYFKFFLPVFVLSGVISAVNITSNLMERGKLQVPEMLTKASFFIYCTHYILILGALNTLFKKIAGEDNVGALFVTYFTVPFLCAALTLCIYLLMRRFTPRLLSLFTGNR